MKERTDLSTQDLVLTQDWVCLHKTRLGLHKTGLCRQKEFVFSMGLFK